MVGEAQQQIFTTLNARWWDGGKVVQASETFEPRSLDTPLDEMVRKQGGRRSQTKSKNKRGRYVQSKPSPEDASDLAFDATLRAAAPYQATREDLKKENNVAFAIRKEDFQKKVRVKKTANLILFLVDGSWSMAVSERMQATKGAILSLLTDAYQRRDRVGLVVFQKDRATLVLAPTNSVLLAQRALASIPVGGKTPLAAGLQMAYEVIKREKTLHPDVQPLLIVLTDGAGNVPLGKRPVQVEVDELAGLFNAEKIHSVVINMEHKIFDQGLAKDLADKMGAVCYTMEDLKGETLYQTVQKEMATPPSVVSRGAGL
ncbi:MAG: VWA domain-containing protein [Anaerolineaceae bacterium]|nr:VWA domain-containing protein [Anaerolineaceae bacterium]